MPERLLLVGGRMLAGSGFFCGLVAVLAVVLNAQTTPEGAPRGPGPGPVWVLGTLGVVMLVNGALLWMAGDDRRMSREAIESDQLGEAGPRS